jgi:hypothetical protein
VGWAGLRGSVSLIMMSAFVVHSHFLMPSTRAAAGSGSIDVDAPLAEGSNEAFFQELSESAPIGGVVTRALVGVVGYG